MPPRVRPDGSSRMALRYGIAACRRISRHKARSVRSQWRSGDRGARRGQDGDLVHLVANVHAWTGQFWIIDLRDQLDKAVTRNAVLLLVARCFVAGSNGEEALGCSWDIHAMR